MEYDRHLVTKSWNDYELLDSGENMKLERFGRVTVARPETQALWGKNNSEIWNTTNAIFDFHEKKGSWNVKSPIPEPWELSWNNMCLSIKLSGFKHTGIFPEQMPNWEWLQEKVTRLESPKVLNLFGYTGAASIISASAGATVTHVDASKQSLDWANLNAQKSQLKKTDIRWILDDALAFAKREVRREVKYDGIILDPPAFGRGAKGEVWKIERDLPALLEALTALLSDTSGSFFLLNGYAAGYTPRSFAQAVETAFGNVTGECGELYLQETNTERSISAGIYVRFTR